MRGASTWRRCARHRPIAYDRGNVLRNTVQGSMPDAPPDVCNLSALIHVAPQVDESCKLQMSACASSCIVASAACAQCCVPAAPAPPPRIIPLHSPHYSRRINSIYFDLVTELWKSNFRCFSFLPDYSREIENALLLEAVNIVRVIITSKPIDQIKEFYEIFLMYTLNVATYFK